MANKGNKLNLINSVELIEDYLNNNTNLEEFKTKWDLSDVDFKILSNSLYTLLNDISSINGRRLKEW